MQNNVNQDLIDELDRLLADDDLDYQTNQLLKKVKLQEKAKGQYNRKNLIVGEIIYRSVDLEDKQIFIIVQECIYEDGGNKTGKQKYKAYIECDTLTDLYAMLNTAHIGYFAAIDCKAQKAIAILLDLDVVGDIYV